MSDSLPPPPLVPIDEAKFDHAIALLTEALKASNINETNSESHKPRFFGTHVSWHSPYDGEIEVTISSYSWGAGRLRCSISLVDLAMRTTEVFTVDAEAVQALTDLLDSFKTSLSLLLPASWQDILTRAFNLHVAPNDKAMKAARKVMLDPMSTVYENATREKLRRLRADKTQGGSSPRLQPDVRQSLHTRYDEIYNMAKPIKKDYDTMREKYDATHHRKKWEEWQRFWSTAANELYPYGPQFLTLFASEDNPSASEVAYQWLAAQTKHAASYIPKLVARSRKDSQSRE